MLCSPMFYIDYPQNPFLNWVQNLVVCAIGKQSRLKWIQEGNDYEAISTQSIGPDSFYRLGGGKVLDTSAYYLYLSSYGYHSAQNNHRV